MYKWTIIFFNLFFLSCCLHAECPPAPWQKIFRPSRISPIKHMDRLRAKALKEKKALTLPATYNILVIRVEFQTDYVSSTTGSGKFESDDIALVQAFMNKLIAYYTENSYGQLILSPTITTTIYTLPSTMVTYGADTSYGDQYDLLVSNLIDYTNVENENLTQYDHFMIYHAGAGQESDTSNLREDDIWSAYVPDLGLSGSINEATFVPEKENSFTEYGYIYTADPLGVICHEYGHQLGLPDLYYTSTASQVSTLGYWTLMDAGVWLGDPYGSNPSHLDAWCKYDVGFITPVIVQGDATNLTLSPAETSDAAFYKIRIPVADAPTTEYFLVEYRYRASGAAYDQEIPGDGVLIYHIDDAIAQNTTRRADNDINNGVPHYAVDIEEADGTDSGTDYGSAGDAFGLITNTFGDPLSRPYNNQQSGITLSVQAANGSGTMNAVSLAYNENMEISKLINYPNPTNDGQTTFHVRLSKPYKTMELLVYTAAGDKVHSASENMFSLDASKSLDYQWAYEYLWNGKNNSGDKVASGYYFYLLRVDNDKIKTSKLAIIK